MLKQKLQQDLDRALKEKNVAEVSTLRLVLASLQNKEKDKRYKIFSLREIPHRGTKTDAGISEKELEEKSALSDEEITDAISSEIKKRRDAIILYEKGGRAELAEKEQKEVEILQKYLPEQIGEEELKKIVKEAIGKTGAKEQKDIGRIMAEVMPKIKGRADGNQVSKIIKELLSLK